MACQFNTVRTRQHAPVLEHGSVGRKNGGVAVAYITPSPIRRHNANLVLNFICSFQRSKIGNAANAKSETAEITRWNKRVEALARLGSCFTRLREDNSKELATGEALSRLGVIPGGLDWNALNNPKHCKDNVGDNQCHDRGLKRTYHFFRDR